MPPLQQSPPRPDRRRLLKAAAVAAGAVALPAMAVATPDSGLEWYSAVVDVVVVGAGLSGLTAARELTRRGCSVVVLEARDLVGGRTWTIPVGEHRYDIGGQFVGPSQDRVRALVVKFGLHLEPVFSKERHIWEFGTERFEFQGDNPSLSLISKLDLGHLVGRCQPAGAGRRDVRRQQCRGRGAAGFHRRRRRANLACPVRDRSRNCGAGLPGPLVRTGGEQATGLCRAGLDP